MRIKSGVSTRAHKKKFFKLAKGNYSAKSTRWRMVKQQVEASLAESYIGRKDKKGDFRRLWNVKINAGLRAIDAKLTYSKWMGAAKKKGLALDRKSLAHLAEFKPEIFKKVVNSVSL